MLKAKIISLLQKTIGQKSFAPEVFIPENEKFGHYSTNAALKLAKVKKENPLKVAEQLVSSVKHQASRKPLFEKIEIVSPGFINFYLSREAIAEELGEILKQKSKYGESKTGKGKTIVIDYSGPNVAKPMNVGHLGSTLIGQALVNLFRVMGWRVIGDNHLGDWGTQFGALIVAWKKWGDKKEFNKNPIDYLVKLYVRFHKEETDLLSTLAREETKKLQNGDKENRELWKLFTKESLKEFNKIYKRLGVKFDLTLGESFYQPVLAQVINDALNKKVARSDDGAIKIFFDGKMSPLVIQKSDESYLYSTTDLAAIKYRMEKYKPEKVLYVVSNEQTLHFSQVFEAAEHLGYAKKEKLEHVKFGMVLGESGKKFSTRRGEFVKLTDLLDEAKAKAAKINKKVAEEVGIGAVKYRTLSQERKSDIVFDWEQMLNLKGNSGPYLQYTYARLKSVLRKAPKEMVRQGLRLSSAERPHHKPDFTLLETDSEKSVTRQLLYYSEILERAAEIYETNVLTDYLFKLANALNYFYEKEPILKAEKPLRENRLNLIQAATIVLKNGMGILAIQSPEKM